MPNRHFSGCPQAYNQIHNCICEVDGVFCSCINCRAKFSKNEIMGKVACPNCGCAVPALHPLDDIEIKINWQELKFLTHWTESAAINPESPNPMALSVLHAIAKNLEAQFPSFDPLTVGAALGRMEVNDPESVKDAMIAPVNYGQTIH